MAIKGTNELENITFFYAFHQPRSCVQLWVRLILSTISYQRCGNGACRFVRLINNVLELMKAILARVFYAHYPEDERRNSYSWRFKKGLNNSILNHLKLEQPLILWLKNFKNNKIKKKIWKNNKKNDTIKKNNNDKLK